MNWNWEEPGNWNRGVKILIGIATIWPPVYMVLFVLVIFSMFGLAAYEDRGEDNFTEIDVIQLDRKIREGEIKELSIDGTQLTATDRQSGARYRVNSVPKKTLQELLSDANQRDEKGEPRVARIEEKKESPPSRGLPFAIIGLFSAHMLTILLMLLTMPFYIVLVVKNQRLDQTVRIVWVVLMCTLSMLAAPVYWYLYIWRKPSVASVTPMPKAA